MSLVEAVRPSPARSAASTTPGELAPGTVIAGRYRVDGVLRRGGMAVVHTAFDRLLLRDVAVKVLPERDGLDRHGRPVETEARIAAAVRHPHLLPVLDAAPVRLPDGSAAFAVVMDLIPGGDLHGLVRSGRLSWPEVVQLGAGLADGLAALHGAGYLHLDVKPANVLIDKTGSDAAFRAVLGDFGAAAPAGTARTGPLLGTAAYLAPEQVRGWPPTDRSDVYALGLVLVEALTGHVEFPGQVEASAFARLERDVVLPEGLPRPVAELLASMTAQQSVLRPRARRVAERLEALVPALALAS